MICQRLSLWFLLTETEQGVALAILRGVIDFKRDPWPQISESAKSLVRQMLNPDPTKRLTAQQVLGEVLFYALWCLDLVEVILIPFHLSAHPWVQNAKKAPNVPLGDIVRSRLKQFSMMNRFKKKVLRVCVFCLLDTINCLVSLIGFDHYHLYMMIPGNS